MDVLLTITSAIRFDKCLCFIVGIRGWLIGARKIGPSYYWSTGELVDESLPWVYLVRNHAGSECLVLFFSTTSSPMNFDDAHCTGSRKYVCESVL